MDHDPKIQSQDGRRLYDDTEQPKSNSLAAGDLWSPLGAKSARTLPSSMALSASSDSASTISPVRSGRTPSIRRFDEDQVVIESQTRSVLVVEDDADLREALEQSLRSHGFAPIGVGSGSEALEAIERIHFDAMLLDLNLPGIHGCRLLRRIQLLENAPPAVILSGAGHGAMVNAIENGAQVVLQKPSRHTEVAEALSQVISGGDY